MPETAAGRESALDVLVPQDVAELQGMIRSGSEASPLRLVPRGLGSALAWCRPEVGAASAAEVRVVSTRGLVEAGGSGIVEYVPGDGTLTALAGARLADLRAAVAEGGHELTPCLRGPATLGGVLATGRSGPDRTGFGPVRHHVLGMQVIDGTGRISRSGGRLVKNVTGFDLHRLHVGARGTLGVILEASLRLMPKAEAESFIVSAEHASTIDAVGTAMRIRALGGVKARALFVSGARVHVLLAGRAAQLRVETQRVQEALGPSSAPAPRAEAATDAMLDAAEHATALRITTSPSRVTAVLQAIVERLGESALRAAHVEPDAAIVDLAPAAIASEEGAWVEHVLPALERGAVHAEPREGASAAVRAACHARRVIAPAEAEWSRRLIAAFDPRGLFRTTAFPVGLASPAGLASASDHG